MRVRTPRALDDLRRTRGEGVSLWYVLVGRSAEQIPYFPAGVPVRVLLKELRCEPMLLKAAGRVFPCRVIKLDLRHY